MEVWYLYLYLGMLGEIEVKETFPSERLCAGRGVEEVMRFKQRHKHSPAFPWCIRGKDGSKTVQD